MAFLKTEIARFFGLGFAGGALLVFATMGVHAANGMANGIVPPAEAAATK
jgi:hypothetical protein